MQRDVYMASSVELRDALVGAVVALDIDRELEGAAAQVHREMARWDGFYFEESRGAWAYELFRREFALEYYRPASRDSHSLLTDIVGMEHMQLRDLATDRSERMRDALTEAYRRSAREWDDHANWGEAHRLTFTHPFAAIPAVGKRYRFGAYPMGGAVQTLMKSGHNPLGEEFAPSHGATARFLSDLSDVDENYAVLVTGQDGWFNSDDFLGMTNMFLRGRYVPMPLSIEAVRARAVSTMELKP
jgi:penicillin amidase